MEGPEREKASAELRFAFCEAEAWFQPRRRCAARRHMPARSDSRRATYSKCSISRMVRSGPHSRVSRRANSSPSWSAKRLPNEAQSRIFVSLSICCAPPSPPPGKVATSQTRGGVGPRALTGSRIQAVCILVGGYLPTLTAREAAPQATLRHARCEGGPTGPSFARFRGLSHESDGRARGASVPLCWVCVGPWRGLECRRLPQ